MIRSLNRLAENASPLIQNIAITGTAFTVRHENGAYVKVSGDSTNNATMSLAAPVDATHAHRMTVAIKQGATAKTVTLLAGDVNVISSGGMLSSGKALPNSGNSALDVFTFEWNGTKWETIDVRYDVKA